MRRTGIGGLGNCGRNELGSWRLEHWSWGELENVPGGEHGGRTRERKTKKLIKVPQVNSVIRQKVSVLILLVLPHGRQRMFLPGLLDLVGSCRQS